MYTLKKSLGQHFLIDDSISVRIAEALKERSFTKLLEVGPGGGALTKHLIQLPGVDFKAVEIGTIKLVLTVNGKETVAVEQVAAVQPAPAPAPTPAPAAPSAPDNSATEEVDKW